MITDQGILILAVLSRNISDRADRCAAAEQNGLPQRARELIGEVLDQAIDAHDAAAALIREHAATKKKLADLIEADKEYDAARLAFFGAKGDTVDTAEARLDAAMKLRTDALTSAQGEGP